MTTRLQEYINGLYQAVEAKADFPAVAERSTLRAFTRDDPAMLVIHPGREVVSPDSPHPMATRIRELLFTAHTSGADRDDASESIFEALQPLVMGFTAPDIVQIEEFGTDEPKYVQGDRDRMAVTKRFRITYQTMADSLAA